MLKEKLLCTFHSRSAHILRTLWKSMAQPHLDYAVQVWGPDFTDKCRTAMLESPLREFTRRFEGSKSLNYWERLYKYKLFSIQRRNERYKVLYLWKSLHKLVPSMGLHLCDDGRRGRVIKIPSLSGSIQSIKTLRDKSLPISSAKLYNSLPKYLREFTGEYNIFKNLLDQFLGSIPDQPCVPGLMTENKDGECKSSNSIIHWNKNISNMSWVPRSLVYSTK